MRTAHPNLNLRLHFITLLASVLVSYFPLKEAMALPMQQVSHTLIPANRTNLSSMFAWNKGGISDAGLSAEMSTIDRKGLLKAVNNSLVYIRSDRAKEKYAELKIPGIDTEVIEASLLRFRELLLTSRHDEAFLRHLENDFVLFKPSKSHNAKSVKFTGYFQPTYQGSRTRSDLYPYPIYQAPAGWEKFNGPHPTRVSLEGYDGLGKENSAIKGRELAYLKTRWEAFMIHVQGSALLEMDDGTKMSIGFDSATNYPFRGVPKEFLSKYNVAWSKLGSFFQKKPELLNQILSKNNRYIFFKENKTPDPIGSLGVPVTAECSIATDKSLFPPGALGLISVSLPKEQVDGSLKSVPVAQFVLDQDTGSAIRGQARVDIFMGSGNEGQKKANHVYNNGELFYLILKNIPDKIVSATL